MGTVLPTPPLRLTHENPVGGPVTGAPIVGAIDKGLHQYRGDAIARLPIGGQALHGQTEHV